MAEDIKLHFSEDEDLEKAKEWWKKNGSSIIWGIAIGLTAVIGFNFWQQYTTGKADAASTLFNQILQQDASGHLETLPQLARELREDYGSTAYAPQAALLLAKVKLETGDRAGAVEALDWVLKNANDEATRHAARLRLAALQIYGGQADDALQLLAQARERSGFASRYAELEGDAWMAKGEREKAREAYGRALGSLPQGSPYAVILQHKLDSTAGAAGEGA